MATYCFWPILSGKYHHYSSSAIIRNPLHPRRIRKRREYLHPPAALAFGLLGTGQVSLSKVVITVGPTVDARDPEAVFRAVGANFDPEEDFTLLARTAMDTLDFTSFQINLGSKMILNATERSDRPRSSRDCRQPSRTISDGKI